MAIILTESELDALVAADRAAGRTIAFANGCFDVLHVGHVRYLAGAAAEADRLIVAVNDDGSVAEAEGARAGRPGGGRREPRSWRRSRGVDYVVVFPDATVGAPARAAPAGRALQGNRLHRRLGPGARDRRAPTAAASPSSATEGPLDDASC